MPFRRLKMAEKKRKPKVEKVLDKKRRFATTYYLVKFKGDDTSIWADFKSLVHDHKAHRIIMTYNRKQQEKAAKERVTYSNAKEGEQKKKKSATETCEDPDWSQGSQETSDDGQNQNTHLIQKHNPRPKRTKPKPVYVPKIKSKTWKKKPIPVRPRKTRIKNTNKEEVQSSSKQDSATDLSESIQNGVEKDGSPSKKRRRTSVSVKPRLNKSVAISSPSVKESNKPNVTSQSSSGSPVKSTMKSSGASDSKVQKPSTDASVNKKSIEQSPDRNTEKERKAVLGSRRSISKNTLATSNTPQSKLDIQTKSSQSPSQSPIIKTWSLRKTKSEPPASNTLKSPKVNASIQDETKTSSPRVRSSMNVNKGSPDSASSSPAQKSKGKSDNEGKVSTPTPTVRKLKVSAMKKDKPHTNEKTPSNKAASLSKSKSLTPKARSNKSGAASTPKEEKRTASKKSSPVSQSKSPGSDAKNKQATTPSASTAKEAKSSSKPNTPIISHAKTLVQKSKKIQQQGAATPKIGAPKAKGSSAIKSANKSKPSKSPAPVAARRDSYASASSMSSSASSMSSSGDDILYSLADPQTNSRASKTKADKALRKRPSDGKKPHTTSKKARQDGVSDSKKSSTDHMLSVSDCGEDTPCSTVSTDSEISFKTKPSTFYGSSSPTKKLLLKDSIKPKSKQSHTATVPSSRSEGSSDALTPATPKSPLSHLSGSTPETPGDSDNNSLGPMRGMSLPSVRTSMPEPPNSPPGPKYDSLLKILQNKPGQKKRQNSTIDNLVPSGSSSHGDSSDSLPRRLSVRQSENAFKYKEIVVKKAQGYTQVSLNSQTKAKNALNPKVFGELIQVLHGAKFDDSCLVLLTGSGNVFCSGVDLHYLLGVGGGPTERRRCVLDMANGIREFVSALLQFPKPLVAAVNGPAVGLGVALLPLCDIVYASDKATFSCPYAKLAQTPEGGASYTLPNIMGMARSSEVLLAGRRMTAMEACQCGLVSQVFWPTSLMQEVVPRLRNMADTHQPMVLEASKLLLRSHQRPRLEQVVSTESQMLADLWSSPQCMQAIQAYVDTEPDL